MSRTGNNVIGCSTRGDAIDGATMDRLAAAARHHDRRDPLVDTRPRPADETGQA